MNHHLPEGSKITILAEDGIQKIVFPHPPKGGSSSFAAIFILFWLVGWYMGFKAALDNIMSGHGGGFLIVWLCAWSLGGLMAIYAVYRIFTPPISESLLLDKPYLTLDTGRPPFTPSQNRPGRHYRNQSPLTAKRKTVRFEKADLKSLKLLETERGNRRTIDKGNDRIEIAASATEVEREWLYHYLLVNYHLK